MEAIAFVLGFVALGALALRFGQDSRAGIRSKEHDLAAHGITWTDLAIDRHAPPAEANPSPTPAYPTLAFVERALALAAGALTGLPDAARLEARARTLTAEHWSDAVWTTGVVSAAAYLRVLAELAPGLAQAPVIEAERQVAAVEPVALPRPANVADRPSEAAERASSHGLAGSPATA